MTEVDGSNPEPSSHLRHQDDTEEDTALDPNNTAGQESPTVPPLSPAMMGSALSGAYEERQIVLEERQGTRAKRFQPPAAFVAAMQGAPIDDALLSSLAMAKCIRAGHMRLPGATTATTTCVRRVGRMHCLAVLMHTTCSAL